MLRLLMITTKKNPISIIQLNISFSSFFEVINKTSGTLFKLYVMVDFA